jgi:methyl-accepting chemotaxis protein
MLNGVNDVVAEADKIITDAGNVLSIMSTGDLTPRITNSYKGDFDKMKNNINHLGDSLTNLILQLQESIHTTAAATAEISSTADTLAAATHEQSSQTDDLATAMEEMSRTVTDNAHSAAVTLDVARESGAKANDGGKIVEQTIHKMHEIAAVVESSASNIAKLGESSKKIGEIISVIDDIADQTNLLSLNAAIEAARAGEQGRGFAVVADSVGKLAISTASATKEIADMIKGIQADTDTAVRAMEKGTAEVKLGIELADRAGTSLEEILAGTNELLTRINQIAAASDEQSTTSEEISKNITSISKVSLNSARNVEDVASTTNELAKMTDTLTTLVAQFKINGHSAGHHHHNLMPAEQNND